MAALAAVVSTAFFCASANAIVVQTPGGPISFLPPNSAGTHAGSRAAQAPTGPLVYHGGPVMHSNRAYAIFWAPSGTSFPAGYAAAVSAYLANVAADSGKPSNVYSVGTQYTDTSSRAAYNSTYGGSFTDTTAYPVGCPPYLSGGTLYTQCVTDQQISNELDSFINAKGLPRGLTNQYFVIFPPGAGSCFDSSGTSCFDSSFCGYHSYNDTGGTTLYADIGFTPADPSGCGTGQYPSGSSAGGADDVLSTVSHEANEMITDPRLNAWYDNSTNGNENGDKCRNTGNDYGPSLGGPSGALYNQLINGGQYYLQMEWSNSFGGCQQRAVPPVAAFSGPATALVGQLAAFNGSASSDPDGTVQAYSWDFGDGSTASGVTASHAYAAAGTYGVTLTVTDNGGYSTSISKQIVVSKASQVLAVGRGGTGSGTISSTDGLIACGPVCFASYAHNALVTLTATPAAGSSFDGWSGACSGTGPCTLTMSTDQIVGAGFTAQPGGASQPAGSGSRPPSAPAGVAAHKKHKHKHKKKHTHRRH